MIDAGKLKRRREALGLTQTELAKRIGIDQTHYSRIEKGLRGASQETLDAVIQVLGISIADIWESGDETDGGEDDGPWGGRIVFEQGEGRGRTRCVLPPTPESYAFVAGRLDIAAREGYADKADEEADPRLEAIIKMWRSADESVRDEIFSALSGDERQNAHPPEELEGVGA